MSKSIALNFSGFRWTILAGYKRSLIESPFNSITVNLSTSFVGIWYYLILFNNALQNTDLPDIEHLYPNNSINYNRVFGVLALLNIL